MAREVFSVDAELFDSFVDRAKQYPENAEKSINEVLWEQGGKIISESIVSILPRSGRTWRGKKKAAADAAPFTQKNENLSVTVLTKNAYHYLYFPDDGSTTRKHAGNKQFMFKGAENEQERIINLCISKITNEIGG